MAVAIHTTKKLPDNRWQVRGMVDAAHRAVIFEFEGEPTIEQCAQALAGEQVTRVEREIREPNQAPPSQAGDQKVTPTPAADPDVAAVIDGTVQDVTDRVAEVDDLDLLKRALAAEEADKDRVTAKTAIESRIAELEA